MSPKNQLHVLFGVLGFLLICGGAVAHASNSPGVLDPHTLVLEDFESPDSLERWDAGDNEVVLAERSDAWSTAGDHSLRITFLESPTWSSLDTVRAAFDEWPDFGEYEYVEIDFFNPTDFPGPTEDSNSQGVVFFAEGSSPNSVSVALQPDSERSWKVSIHDQLAFEKGDPVNVSRIEKLHFYAWNPSRDYVRHVDNIRLTRDLSRHFTEMKSSLEILETAGLDENRLDQLRGEIKAERERLAQLPFNKRNFKQAREDIQNLKEALGAETVFVDQFDERFHELLGRREWTETTRHALLELDKSLLEARRNVRELELSSGAREGFAAETLERVRAELTRVEADLDNARTFLPYASRDRDFVLGWTSTDHFVKPYGTSFEGSFGPIELSGARGETVGAQVVVFALDHIPEMGFELPARHVNISGLGFANIGTAAENSTPHKLQWYPDIIYPLSKGAVKIPAGRLQPLLLDVHIPKDISAGLYFFDLKAKAGGASVTLPIALRVYDFSLPENFSLATTSGFRFPNGLLLPEYGLDAGHLYGGWSDADDDRILEFFERGQRLFNLRNLGSARISRMLERGPEYVRERYEPFLQRMEEIGIPRKHFFFYGLDEVSVNAAEEMRALNALLQESLGVPLMATPLGGDWVDEPADILSIWAGGLGSGETRRERIRDIHDAGGQAWWYDNNLGFLPDVWNGRHKGWYAKHWNMDGYLIYSHRAWSQPRDKDLDLESLPYSNWSETGSANAALTYWYGERVHDGRFGKEGLPSFRLWNFRAGLYDYEYLVELEKWVKQAERAGLGDEYAEALARAKRLTAVPENIAAVPEIVDKTTASTIGTGDEAVGFARAMRRARAEAAELIELFSNALK